jgi:hypothetical protein
MGFDWLESLESQSIFVHGVTYNQVFHWKSDYSMLLLENHMSVLSNAFDGFGDATYSTYQKVAATFGTTPEDTFHLMTHES